jgi:2-oxoglutarate dehydrogenase E1 component
MLSSAILFRALRPTRSLVNSRTVKFRTTSIKLRYPVIPSLGATRNKVTTVNSSASVSPNDVFLQGNTASYIEEMYEAWLKDPSSVHLSWQVYFKNIQSGVNPRIAYQPPPTIVPLTGMPTSLSPNTELSSLHEVNDHMNVQLLVRAYQARGHHIAKLDPLGILDADLDGSFPKELDPKHYGFTEKDLSREFSLGPGIIPAYAETGKKKTLREIVDICRQIYCKLKKVFE